MWTRAIFTLYVLGALALALAEALGAGSADTRRLVTNVGFVVGSGGAFLSSVASLIRAAPRTIGRLLFCVGCGSWLLGNCWWL